MDEIGGSGFKMQDAGCQMPDAGCQMPDARCQDILPIRGSLPFCRSTGNEVNEMEAG